MGNELSLGHVAANLNSAFHALECVHGRAKTIKQVQESNLKYLKGTAGYELQQVAEKLIKIQIYVYGSDLDYKVLFSHNIRNLINYAKRLNIYDKMKVPAFVEDNSDVLTAFEVSGRYYNKVPDVSLLDTFYNVESDWYDEVYTMFKNKRP